MKKLMIGLVLTAVCGVGVTTWAATNNRMINNDKSYVGVTPVNNTANENIEVLKCEIESYINNKYGSNWVVDLYEKNGEEWDDILENELEVQFGKKYDDIIENIIELKEGELGLDKDLDDIYDKYDDNYDFDDKYDNNDYDDQDDIYDEDNDLDDIDNIIF